MADSQSTKRNNPNWPSNSRTYKTWESMKARCLNPNTERFKYYGGRGIAVCERWMTFKNFLLDMGERPEGTTLDRINPNGDYERVNCRWATPREQRANTRPTTHCRYGHELTPGNTRLDKRGWKICRECSRRFGRKSKARMRAFRGGVRRGKSRGD